MASLSLLCRLATSVPPPRLHTVEYAGVRASACPWRARIATPPTEPAAPPVEPDVEPRAVRPQVESESADVGQVPMALSIGLRVWVLEALESGENSDREAAERLGVSRVSAR